MLRNAQKLWLLAPLAIALLGAAPPAVEPEEAPAAPAAAVSTRSVMADYEPDRAGHPLRIIAYALHPIGVVVDYVLFRPAYWIGSHEPLRTLFGRES